MSQNTASASHSAPGRPTAAPLQCVHTGHAPRAMSAQEAADTFCTCMEKHVMASALGRIEAEEQALRRVEDMAARLMREQVAVADDVRTRIARASAVLRKARMAWRGEDAGRGDEGGTAE